MHNLYCLTREQLSQVIAELGYADTHARRVFHYLYRDLVTTVIEMHELPLKLQQQLAAVATFAQLTAARTTASDDGQTSKYLLNLGDGEQIETVQMAYSKGTEGRTTACVSSQVGCALGCVFCGTGQLGFTRNLTIGEIVAQVLFVARQLQPTGGRLSNLVLMGMGEPLLNYDAVMGALEILQDSGGLAIGAKQITISTVGVIPGIVRLADERRKYSLAVSLHAATQNERLAMIPAAQPWPLDELMSACRYYTERTQRKIFFEWTLIAGSNDSPEHARQLAELLQGMPAQVNLIPLNPTTGFAGEPGEASAGGQFRDTLRECRIPCSVRQRRGIEIAAGCGQLAGS